MSNLNEAIIRDDNLVVPEINPTSETKLPDRLANIVPDFPKSNPTQTFYCSQLSLDTSYPITSSMFHRTVTTTNPRTYKSIYDREPSKKGEPCREIVFVYKDKDSKKEEDVTEDFVTEFNSHIGNNENQEKAKRLIAKMRKLGGLDRADLTDSYSKIDIPSARLGFCILSKLDNPEYKMESLDCLLKLLEQDDYSQPNSTKLITLAVMFMKSMERQIVQGETVEVQIKIARIYSALAELLQRQYANHHINSITKELKAELKNTAKGLKYLNRLDEPRLSYHIKCALIGFRRLKDDEKQLFDVVERFYHSLAAAGSAYGNDVKTVVRELAFVFRDLDPHIPKAWYNGFLILRSLAKEAKHDLNKLTLLQNLIAERGKRLNWKFSYTALDLLADLSINGSTEAIRKRAFMGVKKLGSEYPCVLSFVDRNCFRSYSDISPIIHFERPKLKNPNTLLRFSCVEHLISIAENAPDREIRAEAEKAIVARLSKEKDENILKVLNNWQKAK